MNLKIEDILLRARQEKASDIHIVSDTNSIKNVYFRVNGDLLKTEYNIDESTSGDLLTLIMPNSEINRKKVENRKDLEFCYKALGTNQRYRVSAFHHHNGGFDIVIHVIPDEIKSMRDLKIPDAVQKLVLETNGLIIISGPSSSGKTSTVMSMINTINNNRQSHIVTVEKPIEFILHSEKSLIHQREIGIDVPTSVMAINSAIRQNVDVLFVDNLNDRETLMAILNALDSGMLVFVTMYSSSTYDSISRIIDLALPDEKPIIRKRLELSLKGVINQRLLRTCSKTAKEYTLATEVMLRSENLSKMISDSLTGSIENELDENIKDGMHSLTYDMARLVRESKIDKQDAILNSADKRMLLSML